MNQPLLTSQSAQSYVRIAGVLLVLTMVAGFFGELYVPSRLVVPGDAAATVRNLGASNFLFRAGFAVYLVEAICDIALSLVFYVLLKPVDRNLALLAAFFGLVSTSLFGVAELFYFAASIFVGHSVKGFPRDQLDAFAALSLRLYGVGGGIFMAFYGIASILRGYLIYRSGYLPRILGALLAIAGMCFVMKNFLVVLAPAWATDLLLAPMSLAVLSMAVWFLAKGVDSAKWEARAGIGVSVRRDPLTLP
ncbi:MAG: DUF4386 domain-containing protein [Gemmatimonadales bacterium]